MNSGDWDLRNQRLTNRLGILGLILVAYSLLMTMTTAPVDAPEPGGLALVAGSVHSVFGDPVPGAQVRLRDQLRISDEVGAFSYQGIQPGQATLEVVARGYKGLRWEINLQPGMNQILVKEERGLWPDTFAMDFHVFYRDSREGVIRVFGEVGLANGGEEPLLIRSLKVLDPFGEVAQDLMSSQAEVEDFMGAGTDGFVSEPELVVKMLPGQLVRKSFSPADHPFINALYSLEAEIRWESTDRWQKVSVEDVLNFDGDWNPHFP